MRFSTVAAACVLVALAPSTAPLARQAAVTAPVAQFGFNLGDDYQLINYK